MKYLRKEDRHFGFFEEALLLEIVRHAGLRADFENIGNVSHVFSIQNQLKFQLRGMQASQLLRCVGANV